MRYIALLFVALVFTAHELAAAQQRAKAWDAARAALEFVRHNPDLSISAVPTESIMVRAKGLIDSSLPAGTAAKELKAVSDDLRVRVVSRSAGDDCGKGSPPARARFERANCLLSAAKYYVEVDAPTSVDSIARVTVHVHRRSTAEERISRLVMFSDYDVELKLNGTKWRARLVSVTEP